jgi:hypothetical protein
MNRCITLFHTRKPTAHNLDLAFNWLARTSCRG